MRLSTRRLLARVRSWIKQILRTHGCEYHLTGNVDVAVLYQCTDDIWLSQLSIIEAWARRLSNEQVLTGFIISEKADRVDKVEWSLLWKD